MDAFGETGFGAAILTKQHDIIIVGGGIVGLAMACALAKQTRLSVAVLEAQQQAPAWSNAEWSPRVSAFSLASQRLFQSLQVWKAMADRRVSPFTHIDVWDAAGKGDIQFAAKEIGESVLGFIIENNAVHAALEEKVKQHPAISYVPDTRLQSFQENDDHVILTDDKGNTWQAAIAIAADGANSWLRQQTGIHVEKEDYAQDAIVTAVKTEQAHQQTARQVFLETGPLAFLPLTEANTSSIVWSLPSDQAKSHMKLSDDEFKQQLAAAFSHRLGSVQEIDKRYAFPLSKQQAKHYVKSRVVLIGDAAHTIHPLAGQGVNMGLLDAASLSEVLSTAIKANKSIDNPLVLRRYERWRRAENANLMVGVPLIKSLFASNSSVMCNLRNAGLNAVNRVSWIKNLFACHAIGPASPLSRIGSGK